jgi:putative colanic acid biosynthesis UDP-glucose lipid carrier transferase
MSFTAERTKDLYSFVGSTGRRRPVSFDAVAVIAAIIDFVVVLASSVVGVISYHYFAFGMLSDPAMNVGIGLLTAAIFVLAMACMRAYRYDELSSFRHQARLIALLIPSVLAFLLTVIFFLKLGETFSRGAVLYLAVLSIGCLISVRVLWLRRLSTAVMTGWIRPIRTFFICPKSMPADRLEHFSSDSGMKIAQIAWYPDDAESISDLRSRLAGASSLDEVVIVSRGSDEKQLEAMLRELRRLPIPVKVVFDSFTGSIVSCNRESVGGLVAFQVQSPPLGLFERAAKRSFDILFSLLALIILFPIFLVVAMAIKLDSEGPVFFLQRRRGHDDRPFRIIKFRSMTVMEDGQNIAQATRADPRVTRVGAFIRAYSIDELPQFLNVLAGDMSVVGPRPHAVAHDDVYDRLIDEYASRRHVKPGLTGWAQIHGHRGETPTVESMQKRVAYDLWYINNWSLWLDLKIVARTVFSLRGV